MALLSPAWLRKKVIRECANEQVAINGWCRALQGEATGSPALIDAGTSGATRQQDQKINPVTNAKPSRRPSSPTPLVELKRDNYSLTGRSTLPADCAVYCATAVTQCDLFPRRRPLA
jgi:hypothetical protein